MRWRAAALATVAAIATACSPVSSSSPAPTPSPSQTATWTWPSPAPIPSDATPVALHVALPADLDAGPAYACPTALIRVTPGFAADDAVQPIRYAVPGETDGWDFLWQVGFQAWLRPALEIVAPDGKVVAREGQPVDLAGGQLRGDHTWDVCLPEYLPT